MPDEEREVQVEVILCEECGRLDCGCGPHPCRECGMGLDNCSNRRSEYGFFCCNGCSSDPTDGFHDPDPPTRPINSYRTGRIRSQLELMNPTLEWLLTGGGL